MKKSERERESEKRATDAREKREGGERRIERGKKEKEKEKER